MGDPDQQTRKGTGFLWSGGILIVLGPILAIAYFVLGSAALADLTANSSGADPEFLAEETSRLLIRTVIVAAVFLTIGVSLLCTGLFRRRPVSA